MSKNIDWIRKLKVGDTVFVTEYKIYSNNATDSTETITKVGRKYITTNTNRKIQIATGYEYNPYIGVAVAEVYPNEEWYKKAQEFEIKRTEVYKLLLKEQSKERIEAIYEILTKK